MIAWLCKCIRPMATISWHSRTLRYCLVTIVSQSIALKTCTRRAVHIFSLRWEGDHWGEKCFFYQTVLGERIFCKSLTKFKTPNSVSHRWPVVPHMQCVVFDEYYMCRACVFHIICYIGITPVQSVEYTPVLHMLFYTCDAHVDYIPVLHVWNMCITCFYTYNVYEYMCNTQKHCICIIHISHMWYIRGEFLSVPFVHLGVQFIRVIYNFKINITMIRCEQLLQMSFLMSMIFV